MSRHPPGPEQIAAELERVLNSRTFEQAERHKHFLRFVVDETLAGRAAQLKGHSIGVSVFGRAEDFDAHADPLVRVEAGRLRQRLDEYYATEGQANPLRISIPRGAYKPEFELRDAGVSPAAMAHTRHLTQRLLMLSIALAAVLALGAYLGLRFLGPSGESETSDTASGDLPDWPAIYVASFTDLGPNPAARYFALGMSEEIMLSLRDYELITVTGDLTIGTPERTPSLTELRDRYDVSYFLSGSVRNDGQRVRIVSRLIDVATGDQIWADETEEDLSVASLLTTQENIAQSVVRSIAQPYGPIFMREVANLTRSRPETMDTYDCLLKYYVYRRSVEPSLIPETTRCFEEAVTREPAFADAWAGLSMMLMDERLYGAGSAGDTTTLPRIREAARRALELNSNSTLANLASARLLFFAGEMEEFQARTDRLLAASPTDPIVLRAVAQFAIMLGNLDDGARYAANARRLDPHITIHQDVTEFLLFVSLGEYEAALEAAMRIEAPNWYVSYMFRAIAAGLLGRTDMAQRAATRLIELRPRIAREARVIFASMNLSDELTAEFIAGLRNSGIDID